MERMLNTYVMIIIQILTFWHLLNQFQSNFFQAEKKSETPSLAGLYQINFPVNCVIRHPFMQSFECTLNTLILEVPKTKKELELEKKKLEKQEAERLLREREESEALQNKSMMK